MNLENDTLSGWFTLTNGFRVYGRCPACHSPRIAYYKFRRPGLKGISPFSQGIMPACLDCGKSLPAQVPKEPKQATIKIKMSTTI